MPALLAALEERFRAFGPMPAANRRQATLVPSAETLPNPIGSAPGWWVERDGAIVALMPGVPSEMRRMWSEQVRPRLAARFGAAAAGDAHGQGLRHRRVGHGRAARIAAHRATAEGVDAGIYARDDGVHARFSTRGDAAGARPLRRRPRSAPLGDDAYGTDDGRPRHASPSRRLGELGRRDAWPAGRPDTGGRPARRSWRRHPARDGAARYVGGVLDVGTPSGPAGRPTRCSRSRCCRRTPTAGAGCGSRSAAAWRCRPPSCGSTAPGRSACGARRSPPSTPCGGSAPATDEPDRCGADLEASTRIGRRSRRRRPAPGSRTPSSDAELDAARVDPARRSARPAAPSGRPRRRGAAPARGRPAAPSRPRRAARRG